MQAFLDFSVRCLPLRFKSNITHVQPSISLSYVMYSRIATACLQLCEPKKMSLENEQASNQSRHKLVSVLQHR
jgi:hypothetical protein